MQITNLRHKAGNSRQHTATVPATIINYLFSPSHFIMHLLTTPAAKSTFSNYIRNTRVELPPRKTPESRLSIISATIMKRNALHGTQLYGTMELWNQANRPPPPVRKTPYKVRIMARDLSSCAAKCFLFCAAARMYKITFQFAMPKHIVTRRANTEVVYVVLMDGVGARQVSRGGSQRTCTRSNAIETLEKDAEHLLIARKRRRRSVIHSAATNARRWVQVSATTQVFSGCSQVASNSVGSPPHSPPPPPPPQPCDFIEMLAPRARAMFIH